MRVYQFRHFGIELGLGPKTKARTLQRHQCAVNATITAALPESRPSLPVAKSKPRRAGRGRDPYRAREAKKYTNPIPSREYILTLMEDHGAPLRFDAIAAALQLSDPEQLDALSRRLTAMARDGQVVRNRRDGYCLVDRIALVTGVVSAHRDGFGFVVPDQEGADDVYLSPRYMRELLHGDRVAVRIRGRDRRAAPISGRRAFRFKDIQEAISRTSPT